MEKIEDLPFKETVTGHDVVAKLTILPQEKYNKSTSITHATGKANFNEKFVFAMKDTQESYLRINLYDTDRLVRIVQQTFYIIIIEFNQNRHFHECVEKYC